MTKVQENINLRSIATKQSPVYLFLAGISLLILIVTIFFASTESVSMAEQQAFEYINGLSEGVAPIMRFFDAISSIVMVVILSLSLLITRRWRLSIEVFMAGFFALLTSTILTLFVERGPSREIIEAANLMVIDVYGFGFPSVNTTIAFAIATTLTAFVAQRTTIVLWTAATLVALSQLYVGSNLPLDVIGGIALGLLIGSIIRFVFGSPNFSRSEEHVRSALASANIHVAELKHPNVDARGSVPYFVTTDEGDKLFAKIITAENRIADLMFKLSRAILYKDFEDETPFLTAKQAIEHEAYITMLAKSKGVEVPNIRYVIALNRAFAILAMDQLDGKSLDSVPKKKITDKLVKDVWRQIKIMHDAQIAHRDLRLANVFVLSNGKPMLIDFSFGESFASHKRIVMDRVEMLVSFSLLIGAKKAVAIAESVIGKSALVEVAPYLQPDALAGSTTTAIKSNPKILDTIRSSIAQQTGSDLSEVYNLKRVKVTVVWVLFAALAFIILAVLINN